MSHQDNQKIEGSTKNDIFVLTIKQIYLFLVLPMCNSITQKLKYKQSVINFLINIKAAQNRDSTYFINCNDLIAN